MWKSLLSLPQLSQSALKKGDIVVRPANLHPASSITKQSYNYRDRLTFRAFEVDYKEKSYAAKATKPGQSHRPSGRALVIAVPSTSTLKQLQRVGHWVVDNLYKPGDVIHAVSCCSQQLNSQIYLTDATGLPTVIPFPTKADSFVSLANAERLLTAHRELENQCESIFGVLEAPKSIPFVVEVIPYPGAADDKAAIGSAICSKAHDVQAAALIVASQKHSDLGYEFGNSVGDFCAHHCHKLPVVIFRRPEEVALPPGGEGGLGEQAEEKRQRLILVGVDFGDASYRAVEWAVKNLYKPGTAMKLIHVIQRPFPRFILHPMDTAPAFLPLDDDLTDEQLRATNERALKLRFEALLVPNNSSIQIVIESGEDAVAGIGDILCSIAGKEDADCLVLGTERHGGLEELLLGSVAARVERHSLTPVTIVH